MAEGEKGGEVGCGSIFFEGGQDSGLWDVFFLNDFLFVFVFVDCFFSCWC